LRYLLGKILLPNNTSNNVARAMKLIKWLNDFTQFRFDLENDEARAEHITRVILFLMGFTLLIFSAIVLFVILSDPEPISWYGIIMLAILNIPIYTAWILVRFGRWKLARNLLVFLFLALGFFGVYAYNIGTTFLLFFVLAVILSGYYYSRLIQLIILIISIAGTFSISWITVHDWELTLTAGITFSGLLIGIWLLQLMGNNLLEKSLDYQKQLTNQLRDEVKERKAAEKSIAEMNSSLEKRVANRTRQLINANQELYQVTYSIAHDLRAPIRAIIGFDEIVATEHAAKLDPEIIGYLEKSIKAGRKIDSMLEDLLYLLSLRNVEINQSSVNLGAEADRIFNELEHHEISLTIHDTPPAQADLTLVAELLTQLITNAITFSGEGSSKQIEFGSLRDHQKTIYYLKDNGIGISMNYADQIFYPFVNLADSDISKGNGIGLTISRRIVELHQGNIWVESKIGEGSTFFFTL